MKLIVGLGNPGLIYAYSRHNIGSSVVKTLAKSLRASFKRESGARALSAKTKIGAQGLILSLPLTYMNLSGASVSALVKKHKIDLADLLIVLDDLDLDLGRLKLRPSGSSGGQRGLESIIEALGTSIFARLRVGIGRPPKNLAPSDYVLSPFHRKEKAGVRHIQEEAAECCRAWALEGINAAMNIFNKRSQTNA